MSPYRFFFALFGLFMLVAAVPAWMHFTHDHPSVAALSTEAHFMALLVLPATALLYLASWLQPG